MHEKLLSSQFLPLLFPLDIGSYGPLASNQDIQYTIYQEWGIDYCRITNVYRLAVHRTRIYQRVVRCLHQRSLSFKADHLLKLIDVLCDNVDQANIKHILRLWVITRLWKALAIPPLVAQPLGVVAVEVNGFTLPNLSSTTTSFLEGSCNVSSIKKRHDSGSCWPTCASCTIVSMQQTSTNMIQHAFEENRNYKCELGFPKNVAAPKLQFDITCIVR